MVIVFQRIEFRGVVYGISLVVCPVFYSNGQSRPGQCGGGPLSQLSGVHSILIFVARRSRVDKRSAGSDES